MQHIKRSEAVQLEMSFATKHGAGFTMQLIDQLIKRDENGCLDLRIEASIAAIETLKRLIVDGRKKHMSVKHYQSHLESLNFWVGLTCGDMKVAA